MTDAPHEHDAVTLSEATADQIADELGRRYRHALMAVSGPHRRMPETSRIGWYAKGGAMGALGLAAWVKARLSEDDGPEDGEADED